MSAPAPCDAGPSDEQRRAWAQIIVIAKLQRDRAFRAAATKLHPWPISAAAFILGGILVGAVSTLFHLHP